MRGENQQPSPPTSVVGMWLMGAVMQMKCRICGHEEAHYLGDHIVEAHSITTETYLQQYPGAPVTSKRLAERLAAEQQGIRRSGPPPADKLTVKLSGIEFRVNVNVPAEACLPMPAEYQFPKAGDLGKDVANALVSFSRRRSVYIHGLPGSGKDALVHAYSSLTRTPAIMRQVVPGTDIESWFFSRAFNQTGTYWEEGDILIALRDGYKCADGTTVPYLFLVSDIDRADRSQGEYLRMVTDTIQGRINGPRGATYPVFPGTMLVATANTAGAGDNRGRMTSSNPIDASLLERWDRKYEFHWMDWADEGPIVRAKFPFLMEKVPGLFDVMGACTKALRDAIKTEEILCEFSHRGLCSILGHAEDLLVCNGNRDIPKNLLRRAARAWLDGLPDPDTRAKAVTIMDPHVKGGMLDVGSAQGNTSDPLVNF